MTESVFEKGNKVVYPAHGVGEIKGLETHIIGGHEFSAYEVLFEKEKMTLKIPVNKAISSGLRHICEENDLNKVTKTLKSRAKTSRGMWSRRAKEYETKINSGNIVSIAEVVRDLHKNVDDPDRSYSERIIYENALGRLSGEVSAIKEINLDEAAQLLIKTINDNIPKEEAEVIKKVVALNIEDDFDDVDEADSFNDNEIEEAAA